MLGGAPGQSVEECLLGDVTDGGCDAFIEEECDYHGGDTGFSAPGGEITNPRECEEYCLLFQVSSEPFQTNMTSTNIQAIGGCEYWVFNTTSLSCGLLDSSNRTCWGLSGPADPSIETCIACEDKMETFPTGEIVFLQPYEVVDGTDTIFDGKQCERQVDIYILYAFATLELQNEDH